MISTHTSLYSPMLRVRLPVPNINPPVDRDEAINRPVFIWQQDSLRIQMGAPKKGPPGADSFMYVWLKDKKGEVWQGYLYKEA